MVTQFTNQEKKRIQEGIQEKYAKVAISPEGLFKYPTGRTGLEALKYNPKLVESLHENVAASYCGVGNPFALGQINKGEAVLDIGCGAGVDTILPILRWGIPPVATVIAVAVTANFIRRREDSHLFATFFLFTILISLLQMALYLLF